MQPTLTAEPSEWIWAAVSVIVRLSEKADLIERFFTIEWACWAARNMTES
jgi:hypothetical protein